MSVRSLQRSRAFSLVELLVVLGIVALLIAMLIPSLSRAREQANRTKCMSNLRQIGNSLAIYVHDHGDLPPLDASFPVFYASHNRGLLALRPSLGADRYSLVCPDGWASAGDADFYDSRGISRDGAAYMDYAYWPWRFPLGRNFDVRASSFKYRQEKGIKILASDIVIDLGEASPKVLATVGVGNHGSNHTGPMHVVRRTDGHFRQLSTVNQMRSSGASVLFSDSHIEWFYVDRLTQQADGICYPPLDQWR
jgi:prepilin-type N-terminal cleavage/methylation domain-containing protein